MNLLDIKNLNIYFKSDKSLEPIHAVRDLSFSIDHGEMLGVVGESGSGKSITNLAIMGILAENSIVTADEINFNHKSLKNLSDTDWRKIRGREISMIFQDPMTALNPFLSVEYQLTETILTHQDISKLECKNRAIELLTQVGITSPKERLKAYPFELSGGMAQRVMIAMAISSNPKLLIADEPTTALDVTIQKQILVLLKSLQEKNNMSVILVTHDLGLVAEYSDRIQVMYAGEMVETGKTKQIINAPTHPYTFGLLNSRPGLNSGQPKSHLPSIAGIVPAFHERPIGCQFHPRCPYVKEDCKKSEFKNPCLYPLNAEDLL
jgi:oligopeptide/dipeptide ABC transporter ATP-binding protein